MAADSDLLVDFFSNREVDKKVVSEAVRALGTLLTGEISANSASGTHFVTNHVCSLTVVGNFNVQGSKMRF